jgi:hypothetical protein
MGPVADLLAVLERSDEVELWMSRSGESREELVAVIGHLPVLDAVAVRVSMDDHVAGAEVVSDRVADAPQGLPLEARTMLPDGARVLGVHASPGRDDGEGITPDRPEADLTDALAGANADVVCAGHTHRPTDRRM